MTKTNLIIRNKSKHSLSTIVPLVEHIWCYETSKGPWTFDLRKVTVHQKLTETSFIYTVVDSE